MPSGFSTKFRSVSEYGQSLWSETLELSIKYFLDWSYLGIGAFNNVRLGQTGAYGGDPSRLRRVAEKGNNIPSVFEGVRQDWIFESGIQYSTQPIAISGVWINSNFLAIGQSGLYVDYPRGRINMNLPVGSSDIVRCEHSYRSVHTYTSDASWFRQLQFNSFRTDDPTFFSQGSGTFNIMAQNRVQMPAIVVEAIPQSSRWGKEVGSSVHIVNQYVDLTCITEDGFSRKNIHDTLMSQQQMRICALDKTRMLTEGGFPLNAYGMLNTGAKMYPALTEGSGEGGFQLRKFWVQETKSKDYQAVGGAFASAVRWTVESDNP